jgi:hypothetical protein
MAEALLNAYSLPGLAFVVLVAGCAGTNVPQAAETGTEPVMVRLQATTYNAGEIGQASLLPQGGKTLIRLNFSGVPPYASLPVHVYTYIYEAACARLPETPAWSLNDRVLVEGFSGQRSYSPRGPFTLSHIAPVPVDQLLSGRYALALRTAPADGDQVIYCADLREE